MVEVLVRLTDPLYSGEMHHGYRLQFDHGEDTLLYIIHSYASIKMISFLLLELVQIDEILDARSRISNDSLFIILIR